MKYLFIFLIVFSYLITHAQFMGRPEEIAQLKSRTMLVVLQEEDAELIKKYTKNPDKLESYKNSISTYNEGVKALIPLFWKFSSKYEFKGKSEVTALMKTKSVKDYSVFDMNIYEDRSIIDPPTRCLVAIDLLENYQRLLKGAPVYYQNLPRSYPRKGDLAMAIQIVQYYLRERVSGKTNTTLMKEMYENAQVLKSKTLLIDKDDLSEKATLDKISSTYSHPIEIVSYEVIEKAILDNDPKYCSVQFIPTIKWDGVNMVFDVEKGVMLGYTMSGGGNPKIDLKALKEISALVQK